ncbi:LLM class oxidoreductase [Lampropedia puyangensis]|uniref:LLM class oxidoreductase n=1 Tax=Lampropedia puyangensis TaxID=1330072 RepID=A0A4S8FER1_9BURK|nr:LLM class oxidoreductase [Lampropedia puyangensis]THU05521.1 LLM class oxidoreductase [Lampropedia puyangensis]
MFAPDRLTLGIFLPLRSYQGDMSVLESQANLVSAIDRQGFAAIWVRDVPLFDPTFDDAGQVFAPFTYLAFLAARTQNVALATGSAVITLRHPIDLTKAAASIDQLSGGRLVMGIASGDRPIEFPAYGLQHAERAERFAHALADMRQLMRAELQSLHSPLGHFDGAELLPKPAFGSIPMMVTGASGQSLEWIAEHADGWLTYPGATHTPRGPQHLAEKIRALRDLIPGGAFRPHMTNEWIDLVDDPDHPRTPLQGGYVLRTGRKALMALLEAWQAAGVNHAALGIQFSQRPAAEVLEELANDVLPHFPSHHGPSPSPILW